MYYDMWDRICLAIELACFFSMVTFAYLYYKTSIRAHKLESEVTRIKMSANRIGRTIEKHVCKIQYVTEDNSIKEKEVIVWGHLPPKSIDRKLARITGYDRLLVTEISTERFYASMPIEQFIENATIIESQTKED